MKTEAYKSHDGTLFEFNDPVIAEFCFVSEKERSGRLVQVRQGVGQFGSDLYFLRRRDGSLMTFENAWLKHYAGNIPVGIDQPGDTYTIRGEWPESGFIIEKPKQPDSPVQSFSMIITQPT
jgi:hypothetical protein